VPTPAQRPDADLAERRDRAIDGGLALLLRGDVGGGEIADRPGSPASFSPAESDGRESRRVRRRNDRAYGRFAETGRTTGHDRHSATGFARFLLNVRDWRAT
jgi:hypothetical protein